mmetsp:Transcript_75462/g.87712  ORF Transcript_75462/g.87712 Transcript_75462/m.87712 type:complete len:188 (+) Transcript_75462:70-633(+)|eukprot:CAMPEP_0176434016 /NCGR_PEP_ID=MMETSP0127-20121128/16408_1 /TAXON_ID=938130 /ORGANISM="Platyophrya macrostoma, Strain WH" /LENGTH=187 /DNA_ID=CAMNT_0017816637 /DNA_START=47 /DNA_END=610 /DNA_ORIENTATION=-
MGRSADPTLQMKIRQFLVTGRRIPTEKHPQPEIISMRLFARDETLAKSKFWYQVSRQNKLKRANGEIVAVNEIFEKNQNHIKTYAIVIRYQSTTAQHNFYKEYRDTSLNGAVSQMYQEMSGRHSARHETIQIIRTAIIKKKDDLRRTPSIVYRDAKIKFPLLRRTMRPSDKKYRSTFRAQRPSTHAA